MAKKVLIISTSARRNSNSDILADAFMNGAKDAGNEVEKVSLTDKQIAFCRGCFGCLKLGRCVIRDDAPDGSKKHNRLWNGGNGVGTIKLYEKMTAKPS